MFSDLDPLLHSQLRLAVISILISTRQAEFVYLKEKTNSTAGNLSVQIDKLQQAGYIEVEKSFKGKKPLTVCRITKTGINAFENYVKALQGYISESKKKS
jgi:DNA-binding MarR family transcriptional regulator